MSRLAPAATVLSLALLATACGHTSGGRPVAASAARGLTDVHEIGQLRSLFNTRSGEPRLILLVSPT